MSNNPLTIRSIFAVAIALVYSVYILSYVLISQTPPPDGILLSGVVSSLILLYKTDKGKGEEDTPTTTEE